MKKNIIDIRYNSKGFDSEGFDRGGFNSEGFNQCGFDKFGFNKDGISQDGFDLNDFDSDGFNRQGFDYEGFDREGFNRKGFDRNGYDRNGSCLNFVTNFIIQNSAKIHKSLIGKGNFSYERFKDIIINLSRTEIYLKLNELHKALEALQTTVKLYIKEIIYNISNSKKHLYSSTEEMIDLIKMEVQGNIYNILHKDLYNSIFEEIILKEFNINDDKEIILNLLKKTKQAIFYI